MYSSLELFFDSMTKHFTGTRGTFKFVKNQGIQKIHRSPSYSKGSVRDYKKSVSSSLVYRSVKVEGSQYVGFKVTYSGKGNKHGNFNKTVLSIVLIPDINYIRSYRPLAGAVARKTKAEVVCCAFSQIESGVMNDSLIESLVSRVKHRKSKLQTINVISERSDVLELVKERLSKSEPLVEVYELEDAPLSSPERVEVSEKGKMKKRVKLIKIARDEKVSTGLVSRFLGSVVRGITSIFRSGDKAKKVMDFGNIDIAETNFTINKDINLINNSHCDMIANLMIRE